LPPFSLHQQFQRSLPRRSLAYSTTRRIPPSIARMEHFPRFRRRKDVPSPTIITSTIGSTLSSRTTPPPGDLPTATQVRPVQKLSPFRVFHRSSGKRTRDSPPASLPHSPAAAAVPGPDSNGDRPVSPLSLKTDPTTEDEPQSARPPKIPSFLDLSVQGEYWILAGQAYTHPRKLTAVSALQRSRTSSATWCG